jgi:D-Tyr-tRNAtyr deacylase
MLIETRGGEVLSVMCRLVIQRCLRGKVTVGGRLVGQIDRGLVVLCGIAKDDTKAEVRTAVEKMARMHLFEDDDSEPGSGRWVKSVVDKVVVSPCG